MGQVNDSQIPGNWLDQLAVQHHLELGTSMLLFRFAAASDDRAGAVFEGPPLAEFDRDTSVSLRLPPRPDGNLSLSPQADWRLLSGANFNVALEPGGSSQGDIINLVVKCTGVGFGDPGYVLGEVATYWLNPVLQLSIDQTDLSFGTVNPGFGVSRSVHITNVGTGPVTLTVPPPPPPVPPAHVFPFSWQAIPTTDLSSGGVMTVEITFSPLKAGVVQTGLSIQSNAQGSPHHVTLTGTGSKVIPQ